jgi:hypothetical protein
MARAITCPHCRSDVAAAPEPLDDLLDAGWIASRRAATEQQRLIKDYLAALEEFYAPPEPPEDTRR